MYFPKGSVDTERHWRYWKVESHWSTEGYDNTKCSEETKGAKGF